MLEGTPIGSKKQPTPPPAPDPNQIINAESQANRVNQVTPYGNLTYSGPNNNTATLDLNPDVQNLLNGQMGISQGLLDQAHTALGQLPQGNPYAGFGVGSSVPGLQTIGQSQNPQAPTLGSVGVAAQNTPNLQQSIGGLNFGNAAPLPQNYQGFNQNAANAFYNNSAGLLNQQFNRDQGALDQKLANQGLQSGGAAYNDQYNQFLTNKNQQFGNLANQAVMFGGQDASRQLADQLALRGQGTNEAQALFGAGLTQGNFGNQAALSQFGLGSTQRDQQLQNQMLGNETASQQFGLQNQQLSNQMNLANQNNAARGQAFGEAGNQQSAQFNQLASLLGLQQVQAPQLSNFYAPGQVNAGNAYGLQQASLNNTYNQQSQNASSKKGSSAELAGTIGAAALMFSDSRLKRAITKIGRYKSHNIYLWAWNKTAEKLGLKGFGLGVLAEEVPIYLVSLKNGYLAVDYGAL